ncbi:peptide/nickel transport system ATP-binding protein [Pseudonocardia ammonioxydans]|uniref:Peptide/nickel transport system ATP-binding protein n=1 Tax=Pseudonocardia ammonioxydans TaxID=260086 RepID=A0A1I4X5K3_PSUAM|nr:ABC transporter ATP-binding protein [Pseudonocardia ammonioxydans]SFN20975.1 peptide/nickel transport system ATP-binding protein [Pseudonocardia ammonioxydans]
MSSATVTTHPTAADAPVAGPAVVVENLRVAFAGREVVHGISFAAERGSCLAIVGESGSGKSVSARSLVGLAGPGAEVRADTLAVGGLDVRGFGERSWRRVRGDRIGFVLQDALVSLDPVRPVGREIAEALRVHGVVPRSGRREKVLELLRDAAVPEPELRAAQRPGELSGGLCQRALIASALAADPDVIVADEPTTALDVTVQAQVLELLADLKRAGRTIVLISHDLSVVAHLADHVLVMAGGRVVEEGPAGQVLGAPREPYTRALLQAVPGAGTRGQRLSPAPQVPLPPSPGRRRSAPGADGSPVLAAHGLVKDFPLPDGGRLRAVDDVGFSLRAGSTLGVVGESGSGKSTTARLALALESADRGSVELHGAAWSGLAEKHRRGRRGAISVVSQDPLSSFDPRWSVEQVLLDAVPGADHPTAAARRARVADLVARVGLDPAVLGRRPLTLSGGQRQRVAIARALAPDPDVVVLDEAVSALDVSVQAQILDLLVDLQQAFGLAYLFISHDLGVISHLSDHVLVMKDGRVVEEGHPEQLFTPPADPYTRRLVASLRRLETRPALERTTP